MRGLFNEGPFVKYSERSSTAMTRAQVEMLSSRLLDYIDELEEKEEVSAEEQNVNGYLARLPRGSRENRREVG